MEQPGNGCNVMVMTADMQRDFGRAVFFLTFDAGVSRNTEPALASLGLTEAHDDGFSDIYQQHMVNLS